MLAPKLDQSRITFIEDVRAGLRRGGQKELPSAYLYDEIGTALFETITLLPEYGLTRADERLLHQYAGQLSRQVPSSLVAELGSGSGRKTRWILEALARRREVTYYPIDISRSALVKCRCELGGIPGVQMNGLELSYLDGLNILAERRRRGESLFVLFLGSTIGNFDRAGAQDFLAQIRARMAPGDALLLGTDLIKPEEQVLAAYNDAIGVTAAFNLNVLARINRELAGDFDLSSFEHRAIYKRAERRIEMHLVSRRAQRASIRAADMTVSLRAGETIWTESSHKFEPQDIRAMAHRSGFEMSAQWIDKEWPFAESLLVATS
jgi:dimethylhistidine N-methyltransferase